MLDIAKHPEAQARLAALEARVAQDRIDLCAPAENWVKPTTHEDGHVYDVVVVGGGMCGLLAQNALLSGGIRNFLQIDRAEEGLEGPWLTYARMETLRSPKHLTGPAMGYASLTFAAWYRAAYGEDAWEALDKIPRPTWMHYLIWYRKVLGLKIHNGTELDLIEEDGDLLRLHLSGPNAPAKTVLTRKLVMATGRDGTGLPNIPSFVDHLPRGEAWAHSADDIDFTSLKGKRVVVIGVGASAVDNSAEALEAGAAEVRHLIRRKEMPVINKMMGIGSFGFTNGFTHVPDEWRWRMMRYSFETQTPSPRGSTLRVSRHKNAYFHFGKGIARIEKHGEGLRIHTSDGSALDTDFVILGTGFTVEPEGRTEFGENSKEIQLWRDVYTPPEGEEREDLGNFPYLNPNFTFREKTPGNAPWLRHVYCFNYGSSASMGKVSGDIPGITEGVNWLVSDLAGTLYKEDIAQHWQDMVDYSKPELLGDEWEATEMPDVLVEDAV